MAAFRDSSDAGEARAPQPERAAAIGARLFAERGYAGTTTREISRALGVTNGTFYHHFETKEQLLLKICEESLGHMLNAANTTVAAHRLAGPRSQLEALIRGHVTTMLHDQALHMTGLLELRALTDAPRAVVEAKRNEYKDILRSQIASCQEAGVVRSDITADLLTLLLLNMLNWTVFWFDRSRALTPAELGDAMVSLFMDGAGSP